MAVARRTIEPVPAFEAAFAQARERLPGAKLPALADWRQASFARFREQGIPTNRVEAWKYTNVARVVNVPMGLAPKVQVRLDDLAPYLAGGPKARRMIFVNGHVVPELCHIESLPAGLRITSLGKVLEAEPEKVTAILRATAEDDRSFTALNAAFAGSGAWIEVDDGVEVVEPLQLLFLTVGRPEPFMTHPRNVVRLGKGAKLRLIETHAGSGEGQSLTNLVTQIELGPDSALEQDRVELLNDGASHIGKAYVRLADRARLVQTVATLGGGLVRNETEARLDGSNIECLLNGLYLACGKEHVDNLIRVHHEKPASHSDQFYKGVIADRAHAAFAGKIIVHKDAQKTNGYQKNDNLLLSDDAEIDTKPELEIYADDVKCSHGATSGNLDPVALFYLRSRGLERETAESLLTFAFAAEVIERFSDETVRRQVRRVALSRLPGGAALGDLA
ncbi:Fe-S cluster assembly protein SufD [Benzoatithermus flavus]|uniref:Fe-S cluster assembly protein SufD n=1 Tax=Benzoatithermus flavus TaxID=3108223 RepID=A0ABU8XNA9_9PROT